MTFINWSDSEEMLGLLYEYVSDEKSDPQNDQTRVRFLADLSADLLNLASHASEISTDEAIERLRALYDSQALDFADDPVLTHLQECIGELERIKSSRLT